MKKVVALLMVLAVSSTMVFAAPVSLIGSLDSTSWDVTHVGMSVKTDSLNDFDDLFTDVQATALTQEEANAVEGEGWVLGGIFGAIGTGVATLGYHFLGGYNWSTSYFMGLTTAGLICFAIGYNIK
jgi:hypothetical protein